MLHTMRVDYAPSIFDILQFADVIQSRMACDSIKRVEINPVPKGGVESFESATLTRLRQLRDIGLDIKALSSTFYSLRAFLES